MADKQFDFRKELEIMRSNYIKKPLKDIKIKRPEWMGPHDELNAIFEDKEILLSSGMIYLAQVVQANELLFNRKEKKSNCPALFIYTTDAATNGNPALLRALAHKLFSYKDKDPDDVPEEWREAARIITDEMDRKAMKFTVPGDNGPIEVYFITLLVFREYLPEKTIIGNTIPVIGCPQHCDSILVLPKKYWGKDFTKAWVKGEI